MKTNEAGLKIIKNHEGLRLVSYPDPATGNIPWTVGYGSTFNVTKGMTITKEQAEEFLKRDVVVFEEGIIKRLPNIQLTSNQFSALVSLCYNCGYSPLVGSVGQKLKENDIQGAADAFLLYDKAAGKVFDGLEKRRQDERALFLTSDTPSSDIQDSAAPSEDDIKKMLGDIETKILN